MVTLCWQADNGVISMSRSGVLLMLVMASCDYGTAWAEPTLTPPTEVAEEYPRALGGYCAVTLVAAGIWKEGDVRFGVIHRRRTFLFASAEEQQKFLADADRYCPVLTGYDPVIYVRTGKLVEGSSKHSLAYRKQIYLFVDDASLQTFVKDSHEMSEALRETMVRAEGKLAR